MRSPVSLFRKITKLFRLFFRVVVQVQTVIIFGIVYYLLFSPLAFVYRLLHIQRSISSKHSGTYWTPRNRESDQRPYLQF
ncbi:MAG: hypothetical protein A2785_02710 [Candidatus Chisholmbacteria bacterium RIFCSPHIGHO2_01_FULL_49_18]|uniref:Uncharacterized protein n=1 Tax=Candidatus Chisholmbacteria bacterium RIFCSPHIGHO2_01_FULL_49_18 TaxID=1797590 RepID=A0A1G1VLE0_9BACT|nr:MAG: hypothetical protein A2785_02710 [Candidatus Chisholmbacteria bacterium RIFCSPHIGHO2_01_FULL_49_18]